jgi:hypothetical protein
MNSVFAIEAISLVMHFFSNKKVGTRTHFLDKY